MLLHSITLTNLLSFNETTLELRPLNVLIGPNASGKSNLDFRYQFVESGAR